MNAYYDSTILKYSFFFSRHTDNWCGPAPYCNAPPNWRPIPNNSTWRFPEAFSITLLVRQNANWEKDVAAYKRSLTWSATILRSNGHQPQLSNFIRITWKQVWVQNNIICWQSSFEKYWAAENRCKVHPNIRFNVSFTDFWEAKFWKLQTNFFISMWLTLHPKIGCNEFRF